MGDYLGLSRWPQCNHRVLIREGDEMMQGLENGGWKEKGREGRSFLLPWDPVTAPSGASFSPTFLSTEYWPGAM